MADKCMFIFICISYVVLFFLSIFLLFNFCIVSANYCYKVCGFHHRIKCDGDPYETKTTKACGCDDNNYLYKNRQCVGKFCLLLPFMLKNSFILCTIRIIRAM